MVTVPSSSSPSSRRARRGLRRAVAVAAALLLLLTMTATAAAAEWQRFDVDADDYNDIAAIDRDANGTSDDIYFDLDNDGSWDTNLYNTRYSDAFLEVLDFDMDENDEVEMRLRDADQREGFDYLLVDRDQNGRWDSWRGYTQFIVPSSNADAINRSNRQNASSQMMHQFRQRTGMSLLYPSVPACC